MSDRGPQPERTIKTRAQAEDRGTPRAVPEHGERSRATAGALGGWYEQEGRHDLPWRQTRDRWAVLVSEVMLQQTQVGRVLDAWPPFIARFPDPGVMANAGAGAVIGAWDRLGYPRRARRLWEASVLVSEHGWPDDLTVLPGVGRYTAAAVRCQADDVDIPAIEVNVRRVVERVSGRRLTTTSAEAESIRLGRGLSPRATDSSR